ncbi:MAG: transcriptional repressor [Clostridia bacterium]|nr:transcriptional repressor [Clostridia bacterium]MBQ3379213.1 transcriptional repressor [Clostridia bacterium]
MNKYMTRQRKILLSFLSAHADMQLSAREISESLKEENISVSAVYRNLAELAEEGKVRKITKSGSREIFFQYTDNEACRDCLHLYCKSCGRTYHMDTGEADMLAYNLAKNEGFAIDKTATVLYGTCGECLHKEPRSK